MDSLYLSERILISSDSCKSLISGGVLVDSNDGTIKRIFTSQQEINSWMFIEHGGEVSEVLDFPRERRRLNFLLFASGL